MRTLFEDYRCGYWCVCRDRNGLSSRLIARKSKHGEPPPPPKKGGGGGGCEGDGGLFTFSPFLPSCLP